MFSNAKKMAVAGLLMSSFVGGTAMADGHYYEDGYFNVYAFVKEAQSRQIGSCQILNSPLGAAVIGVKFDLMNSVPPGEMNDIAMAYNALCNAQTAVEK